MAAFDETPDGRHLTAAEFFAGIGLVRSGLEQAGVAVAWANDIEPTKHAVYAANFDASDYRLGDIGDVRGVTVPTVDIATASFPCVDLSLAGNRRGLDGEQSGLFYEFVRVLDEMGPRRPPVVMLENVMSFVSSRRGRDLSAAVAALNALGYACDAVSVDARWFTAQSRPRLFVIGAYARIDGGGAPSPRLRPGPVSAFAAAHPELGLQQMPLPEPPARGGAFADVAERLDPGHPRWWAEDRMGRFLSMVAPGHERRLDHADIFGGAEWRTAYRRTRRGACVWEIRPDRIAGCLRTANGGSSRQAVAETGPGGVRARWMTPREYARLQGAPDGFDYSPVTEAQALTGFGDAVCVPAVGWLARHALIPAAAAAS